MIRERCSSAPPPGVANAGGPTRDAADCPGNRVPHSESVSEGKCLVLLEPLSHPRR